MRFDMIGPELREQAARDTAKRNAEIESRLDRGEEIDFGDAFMLFDIRQRDELWRFSELSASGRVGCPLAPATEIPTGAWPHLCWKMAGLDFVATTPSGVVVYDIWLRTSQARQALDPAPTPTAEAVPINEYRAADFIDPSGVFAEIVQAPGVLGRKLVQPEYNARLAKAGLRLFDKGRVPGIALGSRGLIEFAPGSPGIQLCKALMVTKFRHERERYDKFPSRREAARELYRWIATEHSAIPGAHLFSDKDDRKLDTFCEELRASFGASGKTTGAASSTGNDP